MSSGTGNEGRGPLRERTIPRGHDIDPPTPSNSSWSDRNHRIRLFQNRWKSINEDLPPQLTHRHIGMISIGGVIGTGLFLGSATALKNGGPIGALLGYFIIGTMVYCLCVSIGEMIAFMPNVGGVVGLADLYVDPAFGFSLGWAGWYNWAVTLPTEISAAAVVVQFWDTGGKIPTTVLSVVFLLLATATNCVSTRMYGEFEFWFSTIKVVTIIGIILVSIAVDLGAGHNKPIFFKNWAVPFADNYLGIGGALGRFLGFWSVLMQASFSFFGAEVPGIVAPEVINASRNVPRALRKVWIRITLFYLGGIFFAGLLVPANNQRLGSNVQDAYSSPFVIAFDLAGIKILPHILNAAILLSAWSAAASDIYVSSRFLFFLAKSGHAPHVFASLIRYPWNPSRDDQSKVTAEVAGEGDTNDVNADGEGPQPSATDNYLGTSTGTPIYKVPPFREHRSRSPTEDEKSCAVGVEAFEPSQSLHSGTLGDLEAASTNQSQPPLAIPLYAILASASFGLFSFLGSVKGNTAQVAFNWLVAVGSVASLQSWAAMLFTYIRWHAGTVYAERQHKKDSHNAESGEVMDQIVEIKRQRHWGQPYLAWYAFAICIAVIFTNGWSVFIHSGWRIAVIPGDDAPAYGLNLQQSDQVALFLSSYIPIPFFLLLTFGYKLIHQTSMVRLNEMTFSKEGVQGYQEDKPKSRWLRWLLAIY